MAPALSFSGILVGLSPQGQVASAVHPAPRDHDSIMPATDGAPASIGNAMINHFKRSFLEAELGESMGGPPKPTHKVKEAARRDRVVHSLRTLRQLLGLPQNTAKDVVLDNTVRYITTCNNFLASLPSNVALDALGQFPPAAQSVPDMPYTSVGGACDGGVAAGGVMFGGPAQAPPS
jgi:hypothetical protein